MKSVLVALLGVAATQAASNNVQITWFGTETCSNDGNTSLVTTQNARCNIVAPSLSYVVNCNAQNNGGTFRSCSDSLCSACSEPVTFSNSQCTNSTGFQGSSAATFECQEGSSSGAAGLSATTGILASIGIFALGLIGTWAV